MEMEHVHVRLLDVFSGRPEEYKNLRLAQVPIFIDEYLSMIMENNTVFLHGDTTRPDINSTSMKNFYKNFRLLSQQDLDLSLCVSPEEFQAMLSQMVPCISCRRSVEQLYLHVEKEQFPGLYPIKVAKDGYLRLSRDVSFCRCLYEIFHCQDKNGRLDLMNQALAKAKAGRRCALHSIDSQRVRPVGTWLDIWECMSRQCRSEVVVLEIEYLWETLQRYLLKHKFCTECKSKVQHAYRILIEEVDKNSEPGFIPALYSDVRCCKEKGHLHLTCKTDFVSRLIAKAVPEIVGNPNRERHAKTMEIAQEEVLTCLGICLFDRLNRIQQRYREEEQTWEIMMCVGIRALRQAFDIALEKKLGRSQLEMFCEELSKEEEQQKRKQQQKKQKKKQKKKNNKTEDSTQDENEDPVALLVEDQDQNEVISESQSESNSCQCVDEAEVTGSGKKNKKSGKNKGENKNGVNNLTLTDTRNQQNSKLLLTESQPLESTRSASEISRDCGYSSETANDNASSASEGSDVACSESFCNHNTRLCSCSEGLGNTDNDESCQRRRGLNCMAFAYPRNYLSLAEQLEDSSSSDDEEPCIPEDEISMVRTTWWQNKRGELRKLLQDNFNIMMNRLSPTKGPYDQEPKSPFENSNCQANEMSVSASGREKSSEFPENGKVEDNKIHSKNAASNSKAARTTAPAGGQVSRRYKGKNRR